MYYTLVLVYVVRVFMVRQSTVVLFFSFYFLVVFCWICLPVLLYCCFWRVVLLSWHLASTQQLLDSHLNCHFNSSFRMPRLKELPSFPSRRTRNALSPLACLRLFSQCLPALLRVRCLLPFSARANPKGSSTSIYHTQCCTRCVCACVCKCLCVCKLCVLDAK